ncbi:MAG: EAL domain-containing protein [Thauera sp.]
MASPSASLLARGFVRLLFLALTLLTLGAQADGGKLRVVTDSNYPPYVFPDADGKPQGYVVDLWKLWEAKTGVSVDFKAMQWADAQRALIDGRADVIDMIFRTPVREHLYDFSQAYATLPVAIYVDASISGILDVGSMQGFAVGVQRGDACVEKLSESGIDNLVPYANYEAILAAAQSGDIKVFCMDQAPANYYLYLRREHLNFAHAFTLYEGQFHWAVAKGDASTFARVEEGMARITAAEREALRLKWLSQPIQFRPYLRLLAIVLGVAVTLIVLAILWIRFLRRLVNARTAEISQKHEALEKATRELMLEKAQLRAIFDSSPDGMALKDHRGVYIDCNAGIARALGLPRDKIIGSRDEDLFDDKAYVATIRRNDEEVLLRGMTFSYERRFTSLDGTVCDSEVVKVPVHSPSGAIEGVLVIGRDITARRQAERELRIAAVAFESQDGMVITDARGVIERVNSAFTRMSGYPAGDLVGRTPRFLKSEAHDPDFYKAMWGALRRKGYWAGEVANRHCDGGLFFTRLSITAVSAPNGRRLHYVLNFQDISTEKRAQELAEHLKLFDQLTDLPNRHLLEDRITHALANSAERCEYGAVMMLDLDLFQRVNDSWGHAVGDKLLIEVVRRIRSVAGNDETLGRFSGDSFVLMTENLGPDRQAAAGRAQEIAEAVRRTIAEPMLIEGRRIASSASIGVTLFLGRESQPEALLRQAELAMYKGKGLGRNVVRFFEDAMQQELDRRNLLEHELRDAIEQEQLALYYQVQVDASEVPIGAEALIRWIHPVRGVIPPFAFIPLAEETGLIEPMGRWALATACQQLAEWSRNDALRNLTLAVNVSPRQFKAENFVQDVFYELERARVPADRLKLEVTESLAIDDFETSVEKLRQLRAGGVRISLDDFGTGNSSLNYLTKLPLSQLKIDKSFVDELPASDRDAMVAQTIIAMGRGLELDVIAEGVETPEQRDYLVAQGCHAFQGYLFGRPQPVDVFEKAVRECVATGVRK